MSVKQRLVTAEELMEMPDVPGKLVELVDGEVVEVTGPNELHHHIMLTLFDLLRDHAREHDLGLVRPDGLPFVLRRNPDLVRIPDVTFVAWDRVPTDEAGTFFAEVPPTLAVEIVSPNDRRSEILTKVGQYLKSGVHQVWVVWPPQRTITIHDSDSGARELGPDDTLDGGTILPGFGVRVGDLFDARHRR